MNEVEQLAAARERLREWESHSVRWQDIYPDATCLDEAMEMRRFDWQMVQALEKQIQRESPQ